MNHSHNALNTYRIGAVFYRFHAPFFFETVQSCLMVTVADYKGPWFAPTSVHLVFSVLRAPETGLLSLVKLNRVRESIWCIKVKLSYKKMLNFFSIQWQFSSGKCLMAFWTWSNNFCIIFLQHFYNKCMTFSNGGN